MTLIGYTMMCEQTGPKQLVRDVALAEQADFDFAVSSDHYFLRLEAHRLPVAGGTSPAGIGHLPDCATRCSRRPSRSSGRCGRVAR